MKHSVEILYGGQSFFVQSDSERALCVMAEDALRDGAKYGLISFIAHILDPDMRQRVREYLSGVVMEITHDEMEGM